MICPCCRNPLSVGFNLAEQKFIAWCGHGPCPSTRANDGAFGRTEEHAQLNLILALTENPEGDDEPAD